MLARVYLAPQLGTEREALQGIADMLYARNVAWIRSMLASGLVPPARALLCAPPWCERGVRYVRFHGTRPLDRERDYFDGPVMFHRGEATCLELSAYDAAAMTVLEGVSASPLVVGGGPSYHCIIRIPGPPVATLDLTEGVTPWR